MKRMMIEKAVLTAVMVAWYMLMPQTGYESGSTDIREHVLSMVSHASAWHLACNLFVLWIMSRRLHLLPALLTAFACSFLPAFGGVWDGWHLEGVTMGFSGAIFAIWGIKWGIYCQSFSPAGDWFVREAMLDFCRKVLPFVLIGMLIPHINWCLHLYCVLVGFAYGRYEWNHR